jgi:hypothetical protein
MWRFWWDAVKNTPRLAWHTSHHVEAWISVGLFLLLLVAPIAPDQASQWLTAHARWTWTALGLVFIHLLMQAVYERYEVRDRLYECELDRLNDRHKRDAAKIADLTAETSQLRSNLAQITIPKLVGSIHQTGFSSTSLDHRTSTVTVLRTS